MNVTKIGNNSQLTIQKSNNTPVKLINFGDSEDKVDLSEENSDNVRKNKASTSKKWGLGLASFAFPGAGQLVNDQVGKGLTIMGVALACGMILAIRNSITQTFGILAGFGVQLFGIIDAVKNAKPNQQ